MSENALSRRGFFGAAVAATALPTVETQAGAQPLQGVGVLLFPAGVKVPEGARSMQDLAKEMIDNIRQGTLLALPNTRDSYGDYCWDFRIEGGG